MKKSFIIIILIVFASLFCGCEKDLHEELAVEQILFVPHQDGEDVRFIYGVYSEDSWSPGSYKFKCGIMCYKNKWPDGMVGIYSGDEIIELVPAGPDGFKENPMEISVRFTGEQSLKAVYATYDDRVFESKVYPFEITPEN